MTRRRWIAVALALVLALVLLFAWRVWPWLAPPPATTAEIAAKWSALEAMATPDADSGATNATLRAALEHLGGSAAERQKWDPERPFDGLELDAGALRALESLVAWAEEGGGLGPDPCVNDPLRPDDEIPPFRMLTLARLAIGASRGPDDPVFAAALRLGRHLRQRGTLIVGLVGFEVAKLALMATRARGEAASDLLVLRAPTRDEILPIFAREAMCSIRMAEQVLAQEGLGEGAPGPLSRWAARYAGLERELAMLRWYHGERFAAAAEVRGDPVALRAALQPPPEDELPASMLLPLFSFDMTSSIDKMAETVEAYEAFVAAEPRR